MYHYTYIHCTLYMGFPGGSDGKESARNVREPGLILGLGRLLEEGNGYPLWYCCLENSMDRGAWRAIVNGITESGTWLSNIYIHDYTKTPVLTISLWEIQSPPHFIDGKTEAHQHLINLPRLYNLFADFFLLPSATSPQVLNKMLIPREERSYWYFLASANSL